MKAAGAERVPLMGNCTEAQNTFHVGKELLKRVTKQPLPELFTRAAGASLLVPWLSLQRVGRKGRLAGRRAAWAGPFSRKKRRDGG